MSAFACSWEATLGCGRDEMIERLLGRADEVIE
jgi:hypothetical protein